MTDEVVIAREGAAGRISLNRPRAIHALTHAMCQGMIDALLAWRDDPAVRLIILDHAVSPDGDPKLSRGFCAGGDVRAMAMSAAGDGVAARAFFHVEYQLNHLMFIYPKPIVAFMDGIVMGGGAGIALPCRYRVATERTAFAMPETKIGLFPDVGGGWFLSRLRGRTGQFLALTGARVDAGESLALGLATDYLPSEVLADVKAELAASPDRIEAILEAHAAPPPPARIVGNYEIIDRTFASDRYEDILAALDADGSDWARKEIATLAGMSPQACKVALRLLAQGRDHVDFAEEMRVEYGVVSHVVQRHDFIEGVRALLVDKDNAPQWQPPTPEEVSDGLVDQIFAPLSEQEEWAPLAL